ncbi:MAG TPA: DUF6544 family protein [Candidatus Acidoferrales bacterium]|nr:DUF6544 family protein [Candidatus Acidoferrales bacterium]
MSARAEAFDNLPPCIRRHLELAGAVDCAPIRELQVAEKGTMRMKPGAREISFTSEQRITTSPPGFSWKARMNMMGPIPFTVIDEFVDGHGRLCAGPLGLRVTEFRGPEVDSGELLRWLASTVWCPTVWTADFLRWEALDDRSARVTMNHAGQQVSLNLRAGDDGLLRDMFGRRYKAEGREFKQCDWAGHALNYRKIDGLLVPTVIEAAWVENGEEFVYYRGAVTSLKFES